MCLKTLLALALTASTGMPAMAIDLAPLWDFNQPELSEQRFQNAMLGATADDQLVLKTQIARTHGLRRDFARAQDILRSMEAQITKASAEVRVRHALEWGRTLASGTHGAAPPSAAAQDSARAAYLKAYTLAKAEQLDTLATDALHMLAFVETAPVDQLKWGQEALAKQLWLERECAAAGAPDPYVFTELEHLYRIKGDIPKAEHYAQLKTTNAK